MRFDNNQWLESLNGRTFTDRTLAQAQKYLMEQKMRYLGYKPTLSEIAVVSILDPRDRSILGMGGSRPDDLVLDQFGTLLAGLIRAPVIGSKTISLKGDDGTTNTFAVYGNLTGGTYIFNPSGYTVGTKIKVGSGTTAPARANFQLETAFATAPESGYFNTGDGSYAAGIINASGSITAGGSGTINETILAYDITNSNGVVKTIVLFRDAISPGKAFVAGQLINVAYTVNL